MAKTFDLDLRSDGVYKHGTQTPVSSVWAFEGDKVKLHNLLSSQVQVDITTGNTASSALFGSSSYTLDANAETAPPLQVVLTQGQSVGASANSTYVLSYTSGSTVTVPVYVNTVRLNESTQDKPGNGATVLQNANLYFDTSAQGSEQLNISSTALIGESQLTLANGMSSAYPVQASSGSFTLEDKGPTGTGGDTITIRVDTSGGGGAEL